MARFSWDEEERRFKHSVHSSIITAMHSRLACDIHQNGRGDLAAHDAADSVWRIERARMERDRREIADLKLQIKKLGGVK